MKSIHYLPESEINVLFMLCVHVNEGLYNGFLRIILSYVLCYKEIFLLFQVDDLNITLFVGK